MELKLSEEPQGGKINIGKRAALISASAIVVLAAGYLLTAQLAFETRFIPGTVIDGIECGYATEDTAKSRLASVIDAYSLEITDGNISDRILAEDIDLKGDFDNELKSALKNQHRFLWGAGLFKTYAIETEPVVSFNTDLLNQKISSMQLVSGEGVTDSANAYLKLDEGSTRYVVVPEVYGTRLDRERFGERVTQAVNSLEKNIDLTKEDFYIKPEIYSDNEAMLVAMDTANKWLGAVITYRFGSNTEVVDSSLTKDWIVIGDDFSTFFDREPVKEYVRSIARKYDTFGDTRTFHTTYGFDVSVAGGNYGYRMNREAEINNLVADIKTGEVKDRKPDYYQEGVSYDGLDIGKTYVEIDLTGQHLFLYKDGNVVLQSELVSGLPARGGTPNGTYRITYCERNATLRGENYETPVAYWMPFNGDIGMHDATWQRKFGGDWYVHHGSHGCVNLPLSMAAQIYSYAYTGMPVVCYRYGTEKYNTVDKYRQTAGLESIFDTQPETTVETAADNA